MKQLATIIIGLIVCTFPVFGLTPDEAIAKGRSFLLKNQNPDGSWGAATKTKELNIYAPVPGTHLALRAATTSLCISALLATGEDGTADSLKSAHNWLRENLPKVKRCSPDVLYNIWTHAYAIHALLDLIKADFDGLFAKLPLRELIQQQITRLEEDATINGGWAYYNFGAKTVRPSSQGMSVATAAILVSLHEAEQAGFKVDASIVDKAVRSLVRLQKDDHSYLYDGRHKYRPMHGANRPAGSLGRSQACNHALTLWKHQSVNLNIHRKWLDLLRKRNGWLDQGRKRPIPHESWFKVAGYYYYFGYYYASRNVLLLPEGEPPQFASSILEEIISHQETDGSWWDYPLYNYGKFYGTPFALMTLKNCGK